MRITNWKAYCGPGVYVCLITGEPVYVGSGKNLLARVSSSAHHKRVFALCDEVLLFPCESIAAARELESVLLSMMQPSMNTNNVRFPGSTMSLEEKRRLIDNLRP